MADIKKVLMLDLDGSCTIDDVREILENYKKNGVIARVKINNRIIQNDMPEDKLERELNIAFSNLSEEEYDSYEKIKAEKEKKAKIKLDLIILQSNPLYKYYINIVLVFFNEEYIDDFAQILLNWKSIFNESEFYIALRLLSSILLICDKYDNVSDKYLELNKLFATIPQDEKINKEFILEIILIFIQKYTKTINLPPLLLADNLEKYKIKLDTEIDNYNKMLEKLKKH